jgi:hypothetical protein
VRSFGNKRNGGSQVEPSNSANIETKPYAYQQQQYLPTPPDQQIPHYSELETGTMRPVAAHELPGH